MKNKKGILDHPAFWIIIAVIVLVVTLIITGQAQRIIEKLSLNIFP
jgi:hypothetical protein